MKTQRRAVDGCRPDGGISEAECRIAPVCVVLFFVFFADWLAAVSGTASRMRRFSARPVLWLKRRASASARFATNSLPETGFCQQPGVSARQDRRGGSSGEFCLVPPRRRLTAIHSCSVRLKSDVSAAWLPENSPPLVRVSPVSSLQPVVSVASHGKERHHGQRDLYFQYAA